MNGLLTEQELWDFPAFNTHCHHVRRESFRNITLHKLLAMTYVRWIVPDYGDTVEGYRRTFTEMEANSYFRWWRAAIVRLYGDGRPLTPETWAWYDERVRQAYCSAEDHNISLLKNACGYETILLDDYNDPGSDHGEAPLMKPVFRCDMFLNGYLPEKTDQDHHSAWDLFVKTPSTLDEYTNAVRETVAAMVKKNIVGLKVAIAYQRSLAFSPDSEEGARKAFGNPAATPQEQKAFGDYMMFRLAEIAAECKVPLQIHTGLGALSESRAIGLRDLIHANPKTKFDLFHGSYPWCDDVLGLAHNYSNVYVNLCWMPILSTSRAAAFLREALEIVSTGRLLWGCDTWSAEESCGARMAMHHCLRTVLNEWIADGVMSPDNARICARRILRDNAAELYPSAHD